VALAVGAPFIDITVTEPKPYRDPMHIFTLRIRAAPKAEMVPYELVTEGVDGSVFTDDCLPCGRPTIIVPIAGTFLLGKVAENPLNTYYRVDSIEFVSLLDSFFLYVTGSGSYLQGGEVALVQGMDLELKVEETGLTTSGAILASGNVHVAVTLPKIDVDLEHQNPESDFHVFSLTIIARPAAVKPVEFRRGDANADGATEISDAIFTLSSLFFGTEAATCQKAADTNDDGIVDVSDAVFLLNFLFLGGRAPNEPLESCGVEPMPDGLTCESFAGCK